MWHNMLAQEIHKQNSCDALSLTHSLLTHYHYNNVHKPRRTTNKPGR